MNAGPQITTEPQSIAELLAPRADEDEALHALRIAFAPGPWGRAARATKLAELEERLAAQPADDARAPLDAWARRHIVSSQTRLGERPPDRARLIAA
jgi:hypothetical protein